MLIVLLWGATTTNSHGLLIEDVLMNTDASLLNTGEPTHEHLRTGSSSCIDLCLVSAVLLASFSWHKETDLFGSDHYPLIVEEIENIPPVNLPKRFLFKRAD